MAHSKRDWNTERRQGIVSEGASLKLRLWGILELSPPVWLLPRGKTGTLKCLCLTLLKLSPKLHLLELQLLPSPSNLSREPDMVRIHFLIAEGAADQKKRFWSRVQPS